MGPRRIPTVSLVLVVFDRVRDSDLIFPSPFFSRVLRAKRAVGGIEVQKPSDSRVEKSSRAFISWSTLLGGHAVPPRFYALLAAPGNISHDAWVRCQSVGLSRHQHHSQRYSHEWARRLPMSQRQLSTRGPTTRPAVSKLQECE